MALFRLPEIFGSILSVPGQTFIDDFRERSLSNSIEGWTEFLDSLLAEPQRVLIRYGRSQTVTRNLIPGHLWHDSTSYGPRPAEIMIVGKMPGQEELRSKRHFVGPSGQLLTATFAQLGFPEKVQRSWYVTNVLKTGSPAVDMSSWKSLWVKDQLFLLDWEILRVRPQVILCVGVEAIKAVLRTSSSLKSSRGLVLSRYIPEWGGHPETVAQVVCCLHPAQALRYPAETMHVFEEDLKFAAGVIRTPRAKQESLDFQIIPSLRQLEILVSEIRRDLQSRPCALRILGVDCEWQGDHAVNKDSYLRTVQIAWDRNKAAVLTLRDEMGQWCFKSEMPVEQTEHAIGKILQELFCSARVAGCFFVQDMEWLHYKLGMDVFSFWRPAACWEKVTEEGAIDIALSAHALDENGPFDLNALIMRYTNMSRYDQKLQDFLRSHPPKGQGFGHVPDDILIPYAAYDAVATYRIACEHLQLLSCEPLAGLDCRKAFWLAQRANQAVLEMYLKGVPLDLERYDELTRLFDEECERTSGWLRRFFNWRSMNLDSPSQMAEVLFGRIFNNTHPNKRLRPPGGLSLHLYPVYTTDKPAQPFRPAWNEFRASPGKVKRPSASTSMAALKLLISRSRQDCYLPGFKSIDARSVLQKIADYRLLKQILKTVLCRREPDGRKYERGHASFLCDDGRIRTTFYQTKETGRWSSSRPPLQNLSKRREEEYQRIFQDRYKHPVRSIVRAPEGKVLIDIDYTGAELAAMAIISGDEKLRQDVRRNQLSETDPDYLDIHSNIACRTFGYTCPPTKAGLKSIGKLYMRIVAKSVIFGLFYGRGARAIAQEARQEGIEMSAEDAQRIIEQVFTDYPGIRRYQEACRNLFDDVESEGEDDQQSGNESNSVIYISTAFRRYRRFKLSSHVPADYTTLGELERQALNFPIQGMIADVVNTALGNLIDYRRRHDIDFDILMQIHDAVVLACHPSAVDRMVKEVLPECLVRQVPIYATDLQGNQIEDDPHYLSYSYSICDHWEEPLDAETAVHLGIHVPVSGQYSLWTGDFSGA